MQEEISNTKEKKKVIGRTMIIFLVILLLLTFFSNTLNNFLSPRVSVEKPESGQLLKEINSTGKVRAKHVMETYVQSQMKVLKVPVKVGDRVKKGQLLIELDTSDIEKQLTNERIILEQKRINVEKLRSASSDVNYSSYENAIEAAKINSERARKKYEDLKALYEIGAEAAINVSDAKTDYDKALLDLKKAQLDYKTAVNDQKGKEKNMEADIKNAQLELELQEKKIGSYEEQLAMKRIAAPGDGTVIELNFQTGAMADSSKPLYKVAETSEGFEFITTIESEAANKLSIGDAGEVSLDNLEGYSLEGKISRIVDNQEDLGSKKDIVLDVPSENLVGGENGSVSIRKNSKTYSFLVPNSALGQDNSGYFVYVLKERNGPLGNEYVTQKVKVLTGESDNSKTGVTNGLNPSDKVITNSDKQLSEGMKVTLLEGD